MNVVGAVAMPLTLSTWSDARLDIVIDKYSWRG
jgi:hypothetical protein